ncbi:hypothetical protein [Neisseria sp. Ec49-e6-T10]|uniref:hypothetical protein n=1 Tax=Neisseria sp. Ec49-e6-T10 TaxID=3140744 RepID=UPI003EB6DB2B
MKDYYIITPNNGNSLSDFSNVLLRSGILNDYNFQQLAVPVYSLRKEILEHILEKGLSSLLNFNIAMEDVLSQTMSINQTEYIVAKFLQKFNNTKRILIIDPYLYKKSDKHDIPSLFGRLIAPFASTLEEIIIVTNGKESEIKTDMHLEIGKLNSKVKINDVETKAFHDRFWIDPDNRTGVVMGTSLNGLGNKISLIDYIGFNDVDELIELAIKKGVKI